MTTVVRDGMPSIVMTQGLRTVQSDNTAYPPGPQVAVNVKVEIEYAGYYYSLGRASGGSV